MGKELDIRVERDHIENLTKASAVSALSELIWNSLDADAKNVSVTFDQTALGINQIVITDDGHGIDFSVAERAFGNLGGSDKKNRKHSPEHRVLHGREGHGRLKALSLGNLVKFRSVFKNSAGLSHYEITLDNNKITKPYIDDVRTFSKDKAAQISPGVTVTITNINQEKASEILDQSAVKSLQEKFAVYFMSYPNFSVTINNKQLDFSSVILNQAEESLTFEVEDDKDGSVKKIPFKFKVIEWRGTCERKIYFCGTKGIAFSEDYLPIRTGQYNITLHILSDYIEELHRQNLLTVGSMDTLLTDAVEKAKDFGRKYIRSRKHDEAKHFIEGLKADGIYPYQNPPTDEVDKAKRQVFDIVALEMNEYMPDFKTQEKKGKKFTLSLMKEVLENDTNGLKKILEEIVNLPLKKREELTELLEKTSLSTIIDTMKEVTDRLHVVHELRLLLFDEKYKDKIKERKHLHQIVKNETWIFGDDYTYGADDVSLKNVLKAYLKHIGRDDFEEIVENGDNGELNDIPDVCLWKQYSMGTAGHFQNLVVELKRPNKTIGVEELEQIKKYARAVAGDSRFPKKKTKWKFVLLATKMNKDAESECTQRDREFGHIDTKDNYDVYVMQWGDVLNEAEARHQYLKEKLNYDISEDSKLKVISTKYSEYIPDEVQAEASDLTVENAEPAKA
jgi:hypothetical protein